MGEIILKEYPQRFWGVAEVFKNGEKIASVNKFYDVSPEWIIIYDTDGGSGYGYRKGDVTQRIYIGDCEFKKETILT